MSVSPAIFMQAALQVATEGLKNGELPIGAVVVLNDQIIARAFTTERAERRLLVHAELRALLEADHLSPFPGKRSDVALFTTLEPCLMCMGAAMSFFSAKSIMPWKLLEMVRPLSWLDGNERRRIFLPTMFL